MVDAFIHDRVIDKSTYDEQLPQVNEEIALTQLEIHEAKLDELDIEAALNFATNALSNAAQFWMQCSLSYLRDISEAKSSLASRTGIEPVSPP